MKNPTEPNPRRPAGNESLESQEHSKVGELPVVMTAPRPFRELASEIGTALFQKCEGDMERTRAMETYYGEWLASFRGIKKNPYPLHPAFKDWEEWKAIVLSTLDAKDRAFSKWINPDGTRDKNKIAENSLITAGALDGKLARLQWNEIFRVLADDDGWVCIDKAFNVFNRMKDRRKKAQQRPQTSAFPRGDFNIIDRWIIPGASPNGFPGLCALDNYSLASVVAFMDGDGAIPMDDPNLVRTRKRLGLVRCQKATWKSRKDEDGLAFERR